VNHQQRESPFKAFYDLLHCGGEISCFAESVGKKYRCDLGICFAEEMLARSNQFFPKLVKILDNAVVNQRQFAAIGQVGVGVGIGWGTVRCPPRVGNSGSSGSQRMSVDIISQHREFARPFVGNQPVALRDHSDSRRVITAVFQACETGHQHIHTGAGTHITDDSTHALKSRR